VVGEVSSNRRWGGVFFIPPYRKSIGRNKTNAPSAATRNQMKKAFHQIDDIAPACRLQAAELAVRSR
jgi:hypothetical protein